MADKEPKQAGELKLSEVKESFGKRAESLQGAAKRERRGVTDVMGASSLRVDKKAEQVGVKNKNFVEKEIRAFLKEEKNVSKLADVLQGIDGGIDALDLAKLSVSTLVKLEDKFPGILLYAFTDVIGAKVKIDFGKWNLYEKPVAGMKFKIDFRGNEEANLKLGAADFLPPSVRCISVVSEGITRTSERRIGLKGRNKTSTGFFDGNGYMPVYSGDTVVVGGLQNAAQNIDLNYEQQFLKKNPDGSMSRDEEAYDNYEKSAEAAKDKEFFDKLSKANPNYSKSKQLSDAEISAIKNRDVSSGINKAVLDAVFEVARDPYQKGLRNATCCYDWASKIYKMAGAKPNAKVVFNYYGKYQGKDCGNKHATEDQYDMVKPGDWLFYNNHNTADKYGCHSAVFIEWVDRDNKIARLASGSRGIPWHIHTGVTDFKKSPLTRLGRPVMA